jgi:hypothetical protein
MAGGGNGIGDVILLEADFVVTLLSKNFFFKTLIVRQLKVSSQVTFPALLILSWAIFPVVERGFPTSTTNA